MELAGLRGGQGGLLPETLGRAQPDLLLGAAELVAPEAGRCLKGERIRAARFGPAHPAGRPVAPAERRVECDLEVMRERIPAGLLVSVRPCFQVLLAARSLVPRLVSRGQ